MRLSGVEFPVMNLNDSTEEGILVPASWAFTLGLHTSCNRSIFSRTRRSRSDGSHSLTHSLSVSTDLTDVTLVSDESSLMKPTEAVTDVSLGSGEKVFF